MKRFRNRSTQTNVWNDIECSNDVPEDLKKPACSYHRNIQRSNLRKTTHTYLIKNILYSQEHIIQWCMENSLLASSRNCSLCSNEMRLVKSNSSDGLRWRCQKNGHDLEISIRKDSWFEKSKLTIGEIIELTYWWSLGLDEIFIQHQMGVSSNTIVDWDMFCREICEEIILKKNQPIGGKGKRVQIDESKFGKRKYHRGHHVEGQWVFGGIEEDSRKNFMVPVDKRDRETLMPIIKKFILPGTTIISDCWKAYDVLSENDYYHLKVNHSIEFVNDEGDHTNKIEGHWRQAKKNLPPFGVKKEHFSSHICEFMWRYEHKDGDLFMLFLQDLKKIYVFDL